MSAPVFIYGMFLHDRCVYVGATCAPRQREKYHQGLHNTPVRSKEARMRVFRACEEHPGKAKRAGQCAPGPRAGRIAAMKPRIAIYGIFQRGKCIYIGACVSPGRRRTAHRNSGPLRYMLFWELRVLRWVAFDRAAKAEQAAITAMRKAAQPLLNKNKARGSSWLRRARYRIVETGETYPSLVMLEQRARTSECTMRKYMARGEPIPGLGMHVVSI